MPIRTRPLGRSGFEVSEIGLGAWQLGEQSWHGPGEEESIEIVHEALRLGCTFIDTASPYGHGRSEKYIGKALEGRRGPSRDLHEVRLLGTGISARPLC
jgi:aryl-alcohol dehydrogenase-like predicted oxidoreductase